MTTTRIEAAAKAIYEELRCGLRADVPYEDIPQPDKVKMRCAAVAAEAALGGKA